MIMKRYLILLLSAALMLTVFCPACKEPGVSGTDTSESEAQSEQETDLSDIRAQAADGLPPLNFNGETVSISVISDHDYVIDWVAEESSGDIVTDAVYKRNGKLQDQLGVSLDITSNYAWDQQNDIIKILLSGDDVYDVLNVLSAWSVQVLSTSTLQNLNSIQYLDFDKPWWNSASISAASFKGKSYLATGELAFKYIGGIGAIIYNIELAKNYNIPDLTGTVLNGEWTYETLYKYTESVSNDINGDGVMNADDQYGFAVNLGAYVDPFYAAFNQPLTKTEDGIPVLAVNSERMADIVSRLYKLFYENPGCWHETDGDMMMYKNSRTLFECIQLCFMYDYLRDSDVDFGLLPYPKLDASQENYGTHNRNGYSLYAVPASNMSPDTAGAVMELAAAENYRTVMPMYFETALKIKYARDNSSAEILDLMMENVTCDFAFFTDIMYILRNLAEFKNTDFASYYAKNEAAYQGIIDNVISIFE